MRDIWYSDKRDLVKWGGLVHLCNLEQINIVLQVVYYRKNNFPKLSFGDDQVDLPAEVTNHFRDLEDVRRLGTRTKITIRVLKDDFVHSSRRTYTLKVCDEIAKIKEQKIIFLDPDTGLAPETCKPEHVRVDEVAHIWNSLTSNDLLVFYQHRFWPKKGDWREIRKEQFADACKVDVRYVKTWHSKAIADDVIFFYIKKG